ncbi:MAG: hypothetical protein HWN81_04040 [Candidatus Lokiarchaeota archaeon]|nr:hypothetical protein [Candidatus Lokiarchaeota archaeon]
MITNKEELDAILEEVIDETKHNNSRISISSYGSQGKKYLYIYHIKKNNRGM